MGCEAEYNKHWNQKHKLEWTETFPLKCLKKDFEEASVDGEHNGNITLCKKPLIPTRQQMILIKALTEVRRVKKRVDRAVDDIFFLLKPDDIMVDYDRASMTRMVSTSVRIDSLSLVNDAVGEETETYLVISKADHIEVLESSVDETGEVAKINPKTEIKDNEGNMIN